MSDRTKIEWASASWNPLRGIRGKWSCVKVSEGCAHCYAERLNVRFGGPRYAVGADALRLDEAALLLPRRWVKPRRVFVCSMTDLFEERVSDEWLDRVFAAMALAPQHQYQLLTKRADRMFRYLRDLYNGARAVCGAATEIRDSFVGGLMVCMAHRTLPNSLKRKDRPPYDPWPFVWCGVSVENQVRAEERIPWLLRTPAAVRFLSIEPLLGPVDVSPWLATGQIHWVITGGESGGPKDRRLVENIGVVGWPARQVYALKPHALDWLRTIRDQCRAAGVAYFHKQHGGPTPTAGGRLLDGREWSEWPDARLADIGT